MATLKTSLIRDWMATKSPSKPDGETDHSRPQFARLAGVSHRVPGARCCGEGVPNVETGYSGAVPQREERVFDEEIPFCDVH